MSLREKLNYHYSAFDKSQLSPDPLEFPHRYSAREDIELAAFISSIFAYGSMKLIMKQLEKIFLPLGEKPYLRLMSISDAELKKYSSDLAYRFYSNHDVYILFIVLKKLLKKYSSVEKIFIGETTEFISVKKILIDTSKKFLREIAEESGSISHGLKFMFPNPETGSACKRMNLFFRWLIRKDELDFGLWKSIPASELIIPVDTHIAKVCRKLKLTSRKNADWKMAEEITNKLKKYDSEDPVKYDFALCHISMRKMKF